MYWTILYIIDTLCFLPCISTVLYMLFFAIMQARNGSEHYVPKKKSASFLVIVTACDADDTVIPTVESILSSDYNNRDFDLVVVSTGNRPVTNLRLKQYRLTLVISEQTMPPAMIQEAIVRGSGFKLYDMALMLQAGDNADRNLLQQLSRSYLAGYKVVQAHRMTLLRQSSLEIMEATFSEINNSIFRQGHIATGFSSALDVSGVAFDYQLLKATIATIAKRGDIKDAEALILSRRIFIDYDTDAIIYTRKARNNAEYSQRRKHWHTVQRRSLLRNLRHLPHAIFSKNYDYADKIIQWMLVPRTWLVIICTCFSIFWPCVYWSWALKWWAALILLFLAFALAVPDYLVDRRWLPSMRRLPVLAVRSVIMYTPRLSFLRRKKS